MKSKQKVKPRWFFNALFSLLAKLFMFFYGGVKFNRSALKRYKNGAVLIYNHYSNKDHYIIQAATNFRSVNYVIAGYFFYKKGNVFALRLVRAIRKEQFKPDLIAIRKIKKVIEQKGLVALAPAGQVSVHGASPYISPAIVKLLRYCNTDVIALQIRGAHLRFPKWRQFERKCAINATFVPVIQKQELKDLSDAEIFRRVKDVLDINDYRDQLELKRVIKGKSLMAGIDSILMRCPRCHQKYRHKVEGNELVCTDCGNQVFMDHYGLLHGKSPKDVAFFSEVEWYNYQKERLREEILQNDYCLSGNVELHTDIIDPEKLTLVGSGELILTKTQLYYLGTFDGKKIRKDFNLELLTQLPFSPAQHFQVPDLVGTYIFIPENKNQVIEWVQAIDVLREIKENN